MNLIISFSGRANGNCDQIAAFISAPNDSIIHFRELNVHACSNCAYECFHGECKYRTDDIYTLFKNMLRYDRVILIVPMYSGNPSALYFIFNERYQDYFSHNDTHEAIVSKLYIIGVYGRKETTPDFIPCFEKWFDGSAYTNRVLGIERHLYGQKMKDNILDVDEEKRRIRAFLWDRTD